MPVCFVVFALAVDAFYLLLGDIGSDVRFLFGLVWFSYFVVLVFDKSLHF